MKASGTTDIARGQHFAKMEHKRSYAFNQAGIAALKLATPLSIVLRRRLGQGFADDVCGELKLRAQKLRSDDITGQCIASIISEIAG